MSGPRSLADRVRDTSTTTGTGSLTLAGSAPTGYQTFNAAVGVGSYFFYVIIGGAEWEVGEGILTASTTLVRDRVTASSNAGAVVTLSAGTKDVFLTAAGAFLDGVSTSGRAQAAAGGNSLL